MYLLSASLTGAVCDGVSPNETFDVSVSDPIIHEIVYDALGVESWMEVSVGVSVSIISGAWVMCKSSESEVG